MGKGTLTVLLNIWKTGQERQQDSSMIHDSLWISARDSERKLWCLLVGSNFEESDEARRECKSPCLNLKYRFNMKSNTKWETGGYIQAWVGTSPVSTENKRADWKIWDQVINARAKPLFQHKTFAMSLERNALGDCRPYYLIPLSLFCLGTIYGNGKLLQK